MNVGSVAVVFTNIRLVILCMNYTQEKQLAIVKQHTMWVWVCWRSFHKLAIFVPCDHWSRLAFSLTVQTSGLILSEEVILRVFSDSWVARGWREVSPKIWGIFKYIVIVTFCIGVRIRCKIKINIYYRLFATLRL